MCGQDLEPSFLHEIESPYLYRPYTAKGNTFHTTCGEASLTIIITLNPFITVGTDYLLVVQLEKILSVSLKIYANLYFILSLYRVVM